MDINQLSPAMQRQALSKMVAQTSQTKYHNTPTESNGITFDSKKESVRYGELMLLQKCGVISDIRLQANFTLQEGYTTPDGERIKPIVYKADFTFKRDGVLIVEDVKSVATRTKTYLIKKKMLQSKSSITITEV